MSKTKKNQTEFTKVINFYELPEIKKDMVSVANPGFNLTEIKLPCRMVAVALSGGGKTNFIMNFIKYTSIGKGTFSHIHVYHKIDEQLYDFLGKHCGDQITFYKRLSDLPQAKDLKSDGHQLVIFDDCVADKNQEKISDYFLYGRKINNGLGCSCIYISQRYFGIPTTVRGQLNYMVLLKIRGFRDLKLILKDANLGIEVDELEAIYKDATKTDLDFLKISCVEKDDNKLLSKNFNEFYTLD
jgi:hypothetical protein